MERVAFIEPLDGEGKFYELFKKEYNGRFLVTRVSSLRELEELDRVAPISVIVLNWNEVAYPHFLFENIHQDLRFSLCPKFVFYNSIDQPDIDYFKEYSFGYHIPTGLNLQKSVNEIGHKLADEVEGKQKSSLIQLHTRRFFNNLYNGTFDLAFSVLETELKSHCDEAERIYLQGLVLKIQKNFKDSVRFLAHGMNISRKRNNLEPKYLHLLGNVFFKAKEYDQAKNFLEAAQKVSPRNLRRKFLLGQLALEMNNREEALLQFQEIHDVCPIYPGIHARIVELKYEQAKNILHVESLADYIKNISDRKLVGLYKKLQKVNRPELERRLLDLMIKEFSKYAEIAINRSDFYGAIKYYNHIKKIVDQSDKNRHRILLFCFARVYCKSGDYTMAERFVHRLAEATSQDDSRVVKLRLQIARGRERRKSRAAS